MTIEPRQIEALQQAFTSIPAGARCEDCPEPDVLWAAVNLELPAKERRRIVQHAAVCSACAEDWRVTWKLSQEQRRSEDPSNGEVIRGPWTRFQDAWPQVAAAALVVLAVGVGGLVFHQAPESRFRGESDRTVRGTTLGKLQLLVPEGSVVAKDQVILKWTPGPEGAQYDVKVTSPEGDLLYTASDLTTTFVEVPAKNLASVDEIYWQVQWIGPMGTSGPIVGPRSLHIR